jgi:hypothetical protein
MCAMCQHSNEPCDDDGSPTGCVTPAAVLVLAVVGAAEFAAVWGAWVFLF